MNISVRCYWTSMAQAIARLVQVDDNSIEEAARMILKGRLVAYPTDTGWVATLSMETPSTD